MKMKRLRIGSLVVLLSLIAAIPASTQVQFGLSDGGTDGGNLPLLVLVNRMELSPEQMEALLGLLEGLLEKTEAIEARRAEFEEEMIAFTGTAEELDESLEAFRAELQERIEAAREYAGVTIDRIKEILTLKQGEILRELFPWLLADRTVSAQRVGSGPMLGQLVERFGGHPEILGQLSQRFGEVRRESAEMAFGVRTGAMMQRLGCRAQDGAEFGERGGDSAWRAVGGFGAMRSRGLDWVEKLVEVLELKLETIG